MSLLPQTQKTLYHSCTGSYNTSFVDTLRDCSPSRGEASRSITPFESQYSVNHLPLTIRHIHDLSNPRYHFLFDIINSSSTFISSKQETPKATHARQKTQRNQSCDLLRPTSNQGPLPFCRSLSSLCCTREYEPMSSEYSTEHLLHHSDQPQRTNPNPDTTDPFTTTSAPNADTTALDPRRGAALASSNIEGAAPHQAPKSKEATRRCKEAGKVARKCEKKETKARKAQQKARDKVEKWRRRAGRGYDPTAGLTTYSAGRVSGEQLPQRQPGQDCSLSEHHDDATADAYQDGDLDVDRRSRRPRGTTWGLNFGGPGKEGDFALGSLRSGSQLRSRSGTALVTFGQRVFGNRL